MKAIYAMALPLLISGVVQAASPFVAGKTLCSNHEYTLAIQIIPGSATPEVHQETISYSYLRSDIPDLRLSYFINKYCDPNKNVYTIGSAYTAANYPSIICCTSN